MGELPCSCPARPIPHPPRRLQVLVFMLQLRWVRAALDAAHKSVSLAWRAAATARHANRFPPLRRRTLAPGAGTLQRSNSAGAVTLASLSSSAATSAAVGRPPLGGGGSILSSASGGGTAAPGRPGSGRLSYSGAGGVVGAGGAGGAQGPGLAAGQVPYVPGLPLRTMLSRMLHFMGVLQQWVSTQMVHDAWAQLEQVGWACGSMDRMREDALRWAGPCFCPCAL